MGNIATKICPWPLNIGCLFLQFTALISYQSAKHAADNDPYLARYRAKINWPRGNPEDSPSNMNAYFVAACCLRWPEIGFNGQEGTVTAWENDRQCLDSLEAAENAFYCEASKQLSIICKTWPLHCPRLRSNSLLAGPSVVMGTLFPTRVPANLLPASTRIPIYWIENQFPRSNGCRIRGCDTQDKRFIGNIYG